MVVASCCRCCSGSASRAARRVYYLTALLSVVPFVRDPGALGTLVTLVLVNVFPAGARATC
jgi:hypothetical protein